MERHSPTACGAFMLLPFRESPEFIHDEPERRGHAVSSMVSGGCIISGTDIRQSLLFTQVKTNSFATLDGAVVLPYVNVARHARLKNVVIDRGVHIPEGLVVGEDPVEARGEGTGQ